MRAFIAVGSLIVGVLLTACSNDSQNRKFVEEYGGLAPFPASARNVQFENKWFAVAGSFEATTAEIQQWVNRSPSLNRNAGERLSATKTRYSYKIGMRSMEVIVDKGTERVEFYIPGDPL